jgi:hypothetical protein
VGTSRLLFEEVSGEKLLLSEEAEQLKILLKREIEKLDIELKAKVTSALKQETEKYNYLRKVEYQIILYFQSALFRYKKKR